MPTHSGRPYSTDDAMLQSMARRWLRENGVVASKTTAVMAKECAAGWHLADGHMAAEGYDLDDLMRAFAQVMAVDDRDRRLEARRKAMVTPRGISPPKGAGS